MPGLLRARKVCAGRGPMADPMARLGCAHRARTAELLAGGPMAIRWRAIGGDPSGRDAEGRAGGDPRAAATRKMRVVPMKRQECRFPEGRTALLRGRRLEWYRCGNAVATSATAPVVSGRWRVLGAASRRAIASRKAVPADVKEQFCVLLHSSFQRERGKVYPIPPPDASGDFGKLKFRARMGVRRRGVPCRRLEGGFPS